MSPTPSGDRKPTLIRLDNYRVFIAYNRRTKKPDMWWEPGLTTADARRFLDYMYTYLCEYLEEIGQPQPPRDTPSPHYRQPPSIYADPATYDPGD